MREPPYRFHDEPAVPLPLRVLQAGFAVASLYCAGRALWCFLHG